MALEAVRRLHKLNLLDQHLLPIRVPMELTDTLYWFPNWDTDDAEKLRNSKASESDAIFTSNIRVKFLSLFAHELSLPYNSIVNIDGSNSGTKMFESLSSTSIYTMLSSHY